MTTIVNGLLGGLVAGVVAIVALRIARGHQSLLGSLRGRTPGEGSGIGPFVALLAEILYATAAGGLFVALELYVLHALAVPPNGTEALWLTLGWALLLVSVGVSVWWLGGDRSLRRAPYRDLLVFHLTYALFLAAWIRLTWIT